MSKNYPFYTVFNANFSPFAWLADGRLSDCELADMPWLWARTAEENAAMKTSSRLPRYGVIEVTLWSHSGRPEMLSRYFWKFCTPLVEHFLRKGVPLPPCYARQILPTGSAPLI